MTVVKRISEATTKTKMSQKTIEGITAFITASYLDNAIQNMSFN
jgi:hypothetical protein